VNKNQSALLLLEIEQTVKALKQKTYTEWSRLITNYGTTFSSKYNVILLSLLSFPLIYSVQTGSGAHPPS
jgi:hypothetical protein